MTTTEGPLVGPIDADGAATGSAAAPAAAAAPASTSGMGGTSSLVERLIGPRLAPWARRAGLALAAVALLMIPNLLDDPTRVRQFAEYLCYAIIAVGLDLAWGYGGMLALGQGVFFGLGAYSIGMYLTLEQTGPGQLPKFMSLYSDYTTLPLLWRPFGHLWFAMAAAVVVPALVAGAVGWLVFHRRIRGPYFALLTQAAALVFWLLLVGQLQLTAGTNGLTNFIKIFGHSRYAPGTTKLLFWWAAAGLIAAVLVARQLVHSRYGRLLIAIRDGEDRVRFLGYDPALTKTVAFAVAAALAGLAGGLSAPIIGIVAPNQFAVLPSILMIVWVAVGGRGTIYGALVGALAVSWLRTLVSESRPDDWQYFQGLLFVVVVALVPGGMAGVLASARAWVGRRTAAAR